MQFKDGVQVYTADHEGVGRVDRVVIDPSTREVSHLVVGQGLLFTEDKVVPLELIASATEEGVILKPDAGDLDDLPPFEQTHYVPLDEHERQGLGYSEGEFAPPIYGYPPYGVTWPAYPGRIGTAYFPHGDYITRTEQNIPENSAALDEGARVISADDKHVGEIESVLVDSASKQVTHFVISQGLIFKDRKLVPTSWITTLTEDEVFLGVRSNTLEQLPAYESE